MSSSDPRSWLERAIGGCFGLLLGALALYAAVRLIESVWVVLVVILTAVGLLAAGLAAFRARWRGW